MTPITFPSPLLIIRASTNSNESLEKASTSSPRIHPPRTSSNLPLSLSANPQTSANLLWILVSAPIILSPPPVRNPATDNCPIHPPITNSCTILTYPITTHADCKSMNLIYQLQCNVCNAFYKGETCCSLSDRMNGHCFTTTVSNPYLPVAIHTQSHQIPFQDCWYVSIIHKLPDSTPDHIRRQFEIAYQLVLQSRHTHLLTPSPSYTYSFLSVLTVLL